MPENADRRQILTVGAALAAGSLVLGSAQAAAHEPDPAGNSDGDGDDAVMDIAYVMFDGMTPLDLVGPYGMLSAGAFFGARMGAPPARQHLVAADLAPIDSGGLRILPTTTFARLPRPHILVVPGTGRPSKPLGDRRILDYIRAAHPTTQVTFSVCTGALLLGAAGILRGHAATTYWPYTEELALCGARFEPRRWVADGKIVTSAGVSAGIDAALAVAARLWGERAAGMAQVLAEYDPDPPFAYGTVDKLPPEDATTLRQLSLPERKRVQELLG